MVEKDEEMTKKKEETKSNSGSGLRDGVSQGTDKDDIDFRVGCMS